MSASAKFPEGFVWGAATAAHQVEGGNSNCDLWALEHAKPSLFREPSGNAADQWRRFADDVAVLAALGLNAYRFSIEWARIEPEEGRFSQPVLDHYQRCIDACTSGAMASCTPSKCMATAAPTTPTWCAAGPWLAMALSTNPSSTLPPTWPLAGWSAYATTGRANLHRCTCCAPTAASCRLPCVCCASFCRRSVRGCWGHCGLDEFAWL